MLPSFYRSVIARMKRQILLNSCSFVISSLKVLIVTHLHIDRIGPRLPVQKRTPRCGDRRQWRAPVGIVNYLKALLEDEHD